MSLCLFNPSESADRLLAAPGWFGTGVSLVSERHQTALRGRVPSASADATVGPKPDAPETSPCRRSGHSKRTARPPKGDGLVLASAGGIETPGRRWFRLPAASA